MATDSWLARSLILCAIISGVGALAGIVVLVWYRSDYAIPLAFYPVLFPFLYYITHTSLRYRHPIDPEILLLTAIACGAVLGHASSAKPARKRLWRVKPTATKPESRHHLGFKRTA